jgi:hypothetical protein
MRVQFSPSRSRTLVHVFLLLLSFSQQMQRYHFNQGHSLCATRRAGVSVRFRFRRRATVTSRQLGKPICSRLERSGSGLLVEGSCEHAQSRTADSGCSSILRSDSTPAKCSEARQGRARVADGREECSVPSEWNQHSNASDGEQGVAQRWHYGLRKPTASIGQAVAVCRLPFARCCWAEEVNEDDTCSTCSTQRDGDCAGKHSGRSHEIVKLDN